MSNIAIKQNTGLILSEDETIAVLKSSLYPGAADESVKMVLGYCQAAGLDPFQKPVHIVPMSVSTGQKDKDGWDIKAMRDVVMPGIGLYRTQAARSGEYAGVTEPEFGEDVTEAFGSLTCTYPKWCKVTVKRLMKNGAIVDFSAKELWKENYATKSNKAIEPNAMWKRRPYAQLAKCAEAQALRKAFPEFGAQPTADEMEGKEFDGVDVAPESPKMPQRKAKEAPTDIDGTTGEVIKPKEAEKPKQESGSVSIGQIAFIRKKISAAGLNEQEFCAEHNVTNLDAINADQWIVLKEAL